MANLKKIKKILKKGIKKEVAEEVAEEVVGPDPEIPMGKQREYR